MLGLQDGELRLAASQEEWGELYRHEAARLRPVLPPGHTLEHIGSTAVPGLVAKPVLDLAVQLRAADLAAAESALPALGYRFRDDAGTAGGRVWVRDQDGRRTHLLHVVLHGDSQWPLWTALRDLLRRSEDARQQYTAAKVQAAQVAGSRRAYTGAKSIVIAELLAASGFPQPES